jgi:hypothetical protein
MASLMDLSARSDAHLGLEPRADALHAINPLTYLQLASQR